jgi:hypothetical protein
MPVQFIEETVFYLSHILGAFPKTQLALCMWINLWILYSIPLIYVSVFMPLSFCFDYIRLVVYIEIKYCDVSGFVFIYLLISRIGLAILGPLCFCIFFFLSLWRKSLVFGWEILMYGSLYSSCSTNIQTLLKWSGTQLSNWLFS